MFQSMRKGLIVGMLALAPSMTRGQEYPSNPILPPEMDQGSRFWHPPGTATVPTSILQLPPQQQSRPQVAGYPVLPDDSPAAASSAPVVSKKRFNIFDPDQPPEQPCAPDDCADRKTFTVLPPTLLWQPPLANPRQPRTYLKQLTLTGPTVNSTTDAAIGLTLPLLRIAPPSWNDSALQFDIFAVHFARSLDVTTLALQDYRFGALLTGASGPWQFKVGYEHTSCHSGDELIQRFGPGVNTLSQVREEVVVGLAYSFLDQFRLYGMYAYAFSVGPQSSNPLNRNRYDTGLEWLSPRKYLRIFQPYAAADFEWRGDLNYMTNIDLQVGVRIQGTASRLAARLFLEYYRGGSPFGQIFTNREEWGAVGFAFDY